MKKIIWILFLSAFLLCKAHAQDIQILVEKIGGHPMCEINGYKIVVSLIRNDSIIESSGMGYGYYYLRNMNDSIKLAIINKLLGFKNDTSICCLPVYSWETNGSDCTAAGSDSKFYNIQIDALFMINYIAFKSMIPRYACRPVLYDKKKKVEINDQPDLIKKVFKKYTKWFAECNKNGKIKAGFPFNHGRYVWLGGKEI